MRKITFLILIFLAISGNAADLPFGISKEMSKADVKSKIKQKGFLDFQNEIGDSLYFSSNPSKLEIINGKVVIREKSERIEMNGVVIFQVQINWYDNEVSEIELLAEECDWEKALENLKSLRDFFTGQGKSTSSDILGNFKMKSDLDCKSIPAVEFREQPCSIKIYSFSNKNCFLQTVSYSVNAVKEREINNKKTRKEIDNKKTLELLK